MVAARQAFKKYNKVESPLLGDFFLIVKRMKTISVILKTIDSREIAQFNLFVRSRLLISLKIKKNKTD